MRFAIMAALAAIFATPAQAEVFSFSYTGTVTDDFGQPVENAPPINASGTLVLTDAPVFVEDGLDVYMVTGISGQVDGAAITGLLPVGTDFDGTPTDNLIAINPVVLSFGGFGFTIEGTTDRLNLYGFEDYQQPFALYEFREAPDGTNLSSARITLTLAPLSGPVPEPATWAMMLSGFGLIGSALRKREGQAVAQTL